VIYGEESVNKFIFDVDGTLTPSRSKIDESFATFFFDFCTMNKVYLVTGSDRPKTVEQIGNVLYGMADCVYNCSGSEVYKGNRLIRSSDWVMPKNQLSWLEDKLEESTFVLRTGKHIEARSGMVNFSIVGRNATLKERALYIEYDEQINERQTIAMLFEDRFPNMQATVGGETGIDIAPKGADKSQILKEFDGEDNLHFFGDAIFPGGNDWSIANAIVDQNRGTFYKVTDWKETWEILNENFVDRT
jgi:phosphomannomutase